MHYQVIPDIRRAQEEAQLSCHALREYVRCAQHAHIAKSVRIHGVQCVQHLARHGDTTRTTQTLQNIEDVLDIRSHVKVYFLHQILHNMPQTSMASCCAISDTA